VIFKGVYMFSKQEYPNMKWFCLFVLISRKDGISKITLNYTATVLKPAVDSLSEMDVDSALSP
jgi:hypothetical protein